MLTQRFFYVHLDRPEGVGYAIDQLDDQEHRQIFEMIMADGPVEGWQPLTFTLQDGDGDQVRDYMLNSFGKLFCSRSMFDVIDANRAPSDEVQWLECRLIDATATPLEYGIIRFSSHPHVVDRDASIWAAGDFLVKPVIDLNKAAGHHIFGFRRDSVSLVVSSAMRQALEAAGCTGVQFDAIAATSTG